MVLKLETRKIYLRPISVFKTPDIAYKNNLLYHVKRRRSKPKKERPENEIESTNRAELSFMI